MMEKDKKQEVKFADCYVLTDKRTKRFILSFLDQFLPHREQYTHTYEIPQLADDPILILPSDMALIEYLEQYQNEVHAIYWYNKEEAIIRGTMCLFTSDGQVIVGIFCESLYPDTTNEKHFLNELMNFCNSETGLIEYQTPAARDTKEFLERVAASNKA